ncbi:HotDog domain-containing protein [Dipodascopsis uninucleata]
MAASRTLSREFRAHSIHCYFLVAGNSEYPVLYEVENVRVGRSFATRNVHAKQNGIPIFIAGISFQKPAESTLSFVQEGAGRSIPPPEEIPKLEDSKEYYLKHQLLSTVEIENIETFLKQSPFEMRLYIPSYGPETKAGDKKLYMWAKMKGKFKDESLHQAAIAYISDMWFLGTAYIVNSIPANDVSMMVSLDHSIYFHAPARADEWLLFEKSASWVGSNRALVQGNIFTKSGQHVASVYQEVR